MIKLFNTNLVDKVIKERNRITSVFSNMVDGLNNLNLQMHDQEVKNKEYIDELMKENINLQLQQAQNDKMIEKLNDFLPDNNKGI